jgi:possible hydroxyacylglutathione hydrolase
MFNIRSLTVGIVATNCYLVWNKATGEGVLIDPGDEAERICSAIAEERVKLKAILLTHGHFDHILVAEELKEKYDVPLYASKDEKEMLGSSRWNLSGREEGIEITDYIPLEDGESIELLGKEWKVLSTPGHTKGSVCYFVPGDIPYLFSGDTLFYESYGRTDLYGGSEEAIKKSIKEKLFTLPEETLVYPGHEEATTIANEKQYNPVNFMR